MNLKAKTWLSVNRSRKQCTTFSTPGSDPLQLSETARKEPYEKQSTRGQRRKRMSTNWNSNSCMPEINICMSPFPLKALCAPVCTNSGSCLLWLSQKRRQESGRPPWGCNSWRHLDNRVQEWEENTRKPLTKDKMLQTTTRTSYIISFRKISYWYFLKERI